MSFGIKISKLGRGIKDDGLVFDTETRSAGLLQYHQVFVPIDPHYNDDPPNSYSYKKITISHGLGFVPAVLTFFSNDNGDSFAEGFTNVSWDKTNIYVDVNRYYNYTLCFYILNVDLEKNYDSGNVSRFKSFSKNKEPYTVKVLNKKGEETFSSEKKKLAISKVISSQSPDDNDQGYGNYFTFIHKANSPVMYDTFGKVGYDEYSQDNLFIGKWKQTEISLGTQSISTLKTVEVSDIWSTLGKTCIIYGKLL